jgi:hypothetical protein
MPVTRPEAPTAVTPIGELARLIAVDWSGDAKNAFDAAVSALVMAEHQRAFRSLSQPADPNVVLEGWIWPPAQPRSGGIA